MSLITSELSHFGISFTRTTVEANCTDQLRSTPSGGYFVAVSINEKQKSAEVECETFAEQNETAEHLVALNATLRRLSAALWMAMDWRAFTNRPMVIEKVNPIIGRTKEKYSAFFPESSLVVVGTIRAQHTSTLNRWALFFSGPETKRGPINVEHDKYRWPRVIEYFGAAEKKEDKSAVGVLLSKWSCLMENLRVATSAPPPSPVNPTHTWADWNAPVGTSPAGGGAGDG